MIATPLPQPTLPNLSVDDDIDDNISINTRAVAPSMYTQDQYYNSDKSTLMTGDYPPPMPAYNPYSAHQGSYTHFQSSSASFTHEQSPYQHHQMYEEDNESTLHLASSAAPFSQQRTPIDRSRSPGVPYGHPGAGGNYDPHDVYQGRATHLDTPQRRSPASGLAYDDASHYSTGSLPAYGVQPPSDNPYGNTHGQQGTYHQQSQQGGYMYAM